METQHRHGTRPGSAALSTLRCEIEAWRAGCTGPQGRVPESLWHSAVLAARDLGAERVSESLSLSLVALQRRLRSFDDGAETSDRPLFLELTAPPSAQQLPSELELLAPGGMKLTLRFHGPLEQVRGLIESVLAAQP